MANIAIIIAASSAQTAGQILKSQDANNTGNDDAVGNVLIAISNALFSLGVGNEKGFRAALKIAADGIYSFLGLTPPVAPPA